MTEPVMVGGAPVAAGNKRVFILLGVAAVIALVALLLPKLLFGGGDEGTDDLEAFPAGAPTTGAPAAPAPVEEAVAEPARTFEVFSTKNPFTPLIDTTPAAAAAPAAAPGALVAPATVAPAPVVAAPVASTPVPSVPAAVVPGAPVDPAPVPVAPVDAAPAPATGPATEPRSGQRVALLEVFVDEAGTTVATVRVNDTVHEVAEGAAFATSYKVVTLSVADGCGQLLYGDDRFRLCEGEELLK